MLRSVLLALGFASVKLVSGLPTTKPTTNPELLKERTISQPSVPDDIKKREPIPPWLLYGDLEEAKTDNAVPADDLQKREPIPPWFFYGDVEEAKSDTAAPAENLQKREPIPPWFLFGDVEEAKLDTAAPADNLEKGE